MTRDTRPGVQEAVSCSRQYAPRVLPTIEPNLAAGYSCYITRTGRFAAIARTRSYVQHGPVVCFNRSLIINFPPELQRGAHPLPPPSSRHKRQQSSTRRSLPVSSSAACCLISLYRAHSLTFLEPPAPSPRPRHHPAIHIHPNPRLQQRSAHSTTPSYLLSDTPAYTQGTRTPIPARHVSARRNNPVPHANADC